jgi:serine/threonine protein kinase
MCILYIHTHIHVHISIPLSCSTVWVQDSGKSPPSEELYSIPPDCEEEVYKVMSEGGYQELPRPLVKISEELGRGQYGRVHKGICTSENSSEQIAVKVLSERQFRLHLLQEAMIMGQFSHPNVLKLHGVVTLIKPMMMVMEYAAKGTLKKYLTKLREISEVAGQEIQGSELLDYSCQVAAGMKYLEEKGFVHRNLSAHNVLLNGHNICKISGFVPSVCTQDSTQVVTKREENANIRWTAPESLMYGKYTVSSDVWSYGMLLYEVWTVGRTPFEVMSYSQVLSIVNTGYCQPPPPGCPRAVYSIMVQCWNPEYRKRPSFSQLFERLTDLCSADFSSSESLDAPQSPDQRLGSPPEEGMCMHMDLQKSYS